jgi:membrane fusion protein (multidrug efflux system)
MTQENVMPRNDDQALSTPPSGTTNRLQKPRFSRRTLRMGAAGLALIVGVVLARYYLYAQFHESTDDAFIDGRIIPISSRVAGHVAQVRVADNQPVAAGDLLLEIDPRDFQARLEADQAMVHNAQALVDVARSQKNEVEAQLRFAKAALEQVQAEQAAVEAKHQQGAADLKRYQELAASHTISPQQLDQAVTVERMAGAEFDAARGKLATQRSLVQKAEAALKTAEDNVRQAEAQVAARQGQLAQSALNLSYTKMLAPCDGHVAKKSVEAGAFVQAGQSLMAIVSNEVWVTANFKETQLTQMRTGQPVTIEVDTYPGATFHGRVQSIQRGTGARFSLLPPENATGNYVKVVQRVPVKIVFDQPQELSGYLLVPGMSVVPEVNIR